MSFERNKDEIAVSVGTSTVDEGGAVGMLQKLRKEKRDAGSL